MERKTVAIVSNNNSATENVYEKLSASKYKRWIEYCKNYSITSRMLQ